MRPLKSPAQDPSDARLRHLLTIAERCQPKPETALPDRAPITVQLLVAISSNGT